MTPQQFNTKINKLQSLLFGFAMKLTSDKENAKDLMQETLMRCYDKRDRFQEGTHFKSWVTTVMYNSYINHYRKRKTKRKVIKPVENFNLVVENKCVDGDAYSIIMMKELKKMVTSLSDDYKIPFEMHVKGYQYDEISEKMDIPVGTVKSRIFYARKKLKAMVTNIYGDRQNWNVAV